MPIQHDYEYEQENGVCSYCLQSLEWCEPDNTGGFYLSCPMCDEYDQEEALEAFFDDWDDGVELGFSTHSE